MELDTMDRIDRLHTIRELLIEHKANKKNMKEKLSKEIQTVTNWVRGAELDTTVSADVEAIDYVAHADGDYLVNEEIESTIRTLIDITLKEEYKTEQDYIDAVREREMFKRLKE